MIGDDRRAAGGGRLGRDHPERLGKDRRHDGDIREREEMYEVPVFERSGEEDVETGRPRLQLGTVVPEADDHGARIQTAQRLEQDLDALVLDELAVVDDGRPVSGEKRAQARSSRPEVARWRSRRWASSCDSATSSASASASARVATAPRRRRVGSRGRDPPSRRPRGRRCGCAPSRRRSPRRPQAPRLPTPTAPRSRASSTPAPSRVPSPRRAWLAAPTAPPRRTWLT